MAKKTTKWGGSWTEQKLKAFEKYVNAYLTIMNTRREKFGWKLIYLDVFAGSGDTANSADVFRELEIEREELSLYKGAAERVLGIKQSGFDFYYFIDKDEKSNMMLESKLTILRPKGQLIFRVGDANEQLAKFADAMRKNSQYRALVLLDPFGMQVNWNSIEKLSGLSIDLWILIPTGVVVNRLLDKKGELRQRVKLQSFFGLPEAEIRSSFYAEKKSQTLFGEDTAISKLEKPIKRIAELYVDRLKSVFKEVVDEPLEMKNSRNSPIFHFAFASNNPTAKKIAGQIIGKLQ